MQIVLCVIWGGIDIVLLMVLLIPTLRKNVNQSKMYSRSLRSEKNLVDIVIDGVPKFFLLIPFMLVGYIVLSIISDEIIQTFLIWYRGKFIVALLPIFINGVKEKALNLNTRWKIVLIVYTFIFNVACDIVNIENVERISQKRGLLSILILIFFYVFVISLVKMFKESQKYYSKKVSRKNIRKDLWYRTPEIEVDISNIELIKSCEKYFSIYKYNHEKINNLHTIEYVNLIGERRKIWYEQSAKFMRIFGGISFLIAILSMCLERQRLAALLSLGLVVIFIILIGAYKRIDIECLYKMGIRYAYDEWGYYLTYADNRSKFVGTVQMIELSKYHKYVHSFLDIVALCRAVAINDQLEGRNRMSIITSNLSELFEDYSDDGDCKQDRNWVTLIPLWAATLFEFSVTGTVNADAKLVLLEYADASARFDISMFLQSFWADMKRKELSDGVAEFVQAFERELYTVES